MTNSTPSAYPPNSVSAPMRYPRRPRRCRRARPHSNPPPTDTRPPTHPNSSSATRASRSRGSGSIIHRNEFRSIEGGPAPRVFRGVGPFPIHTSWREPLYSGTYALAASLGLVAECCEENEEQRRSDNPASEPSDRNGHPQHEPQWARVCDGLPAHSGSQGRYTRPEPQPKAAEDQQQKDEIGHRVSTVTRRLPRTAL